mgnify:CR=1 FL=1
MRNGNEIPFKVEIRSQKFLSYLWGMETLQKLSSTNVFSPTCSYPTYEEWKQNNIFATSHLYRSTSSYPTYEEWKLFRWPSSWSNEIPSSYPTYEEWKQPVITECRSNFNEVLILPMRNGNDRLFWNRIFEFCVLILPMRNGNKKISETFDEIREVLILPMRNGNQAIITR